MCELNDNSIRQDKVALHTWVFLNSRPIVWLGYYTLIFVMWVMLYDMSRGDNFLCGPATVRLLPLGGFAALFPMWAVMMAAMMLPTIIPTLRTYDQLPTATGAGTPGWFGMVTGYVMVWLVGSAVFAALQAAALNADIVDVTGVVVSPWIAAALLTFAGIWQFTRTKEACQDACLTPIQFFLSRWKPGLSGGIRMGVEIGVVCVGCCWAIMSLAFVGGVMSLLWMGLATLFMVMEKLPDIGMHLRRPAGALLICFGVFVGFDTLGFT